MDSRSSLDLFNKNRTSIIVCGFFLIFFASMFSGELIERNGGLGADGSVYAGMLENFNSKLLNKEFEAEYVQRALPLGLIANANKLFSQDLSTDSIILTFRVLNTLAILIAVFYFFRLARLLNLSETQTSLAFAMGFLNWLILKHTLYYPVLLDTLGFMLGFMILYYYLMEKRLILALIALVAAFSWPGTMYYSYILLIFPRNSSLQLPAVAKEWVTRFSVLLLFLIFFYFLSEYQINQKVRNVGDTTQVVYRWIAVSAAVFLWYLYLVQDKLLGLIRYGTGWKLKDAVSYRGVIYFAVVLTLVSSITRLFGTSDASYFSKYMPIFFNQAIVLPAFSLVGNFIVYGPAAVFLVLSLAPFFEKLKEYGLGLGLYAGLALIQCMDAEGRHMIHCLPPLFVLLSMVFTKLTWRHVLAIVLMQIGISRFWIPVNPDFPQRYLSFYGPWVTGPDYKVHLIYIGLVAVFFFLFMRAQDGRRWTLPRFH